MNALYYALRTLIRGRGSNVIKMISLTLGLLAGILLFSKVAYELRYNSGYRDADNLCVVAARYTQDGVKGEPTYIILGPVAGAIAADFPEIEYGSVTQDRYDGNYYWGEKHHTTVTMCVDTLFFQTLGFDLVRGNIEELNTPGGIFISDEFARQVFGDENPIGKVLLQDKKEELTVKGVYRQVGKNNTIRPHVVIAFQDYSAHTWGGGDRYKGYIRLRPGADIAQINARMDAVIEQYVEFNPEKNGWGVQYELQRMRDIHIKNPELRIKLTIMSVLGCLILLIAGLNYVLISISSFVLRAKGVGVHKCNGATDGNIFSMFVWESLIIIGMSLALVWVMICLFKEVIEDLLESPISGMLSWDTLWVPLSVALLLFVITGVIPARMFSSISVTHVFRRYTEGKQSWKRPLLFVQFIGVSFIFGFLCVVMIQYREVTTFNLGYRTEELATARCNIDNLDMVKRTLQRMPMVEDVAFSMGDIGTRLSGDFVKGADGRILFSTRFNICDENYPSLLGVNIVEGKNMDGPNQILVNQEYVRLMRWTDSPIGKRGSGVTPEESVIVGVMEDFVDDNLFVATQPVTFCSGKWWRSWITVRLKEPYAENVKALNEAVAEAFPTDRLVFTYTPDRLLWKYESTRRFRDLVVLAFTSILLITLMGLLGYVNDEVRRRSKEIAIRKVNGAENYDVLKLLSKEVAWLAFPAVIMGVTGAYFIGNNWLTQFERFHISPGVPLFMLVSIFVLLVIFGTVIIKAWHIANDNPVNSIKSE